MVDLETIEREINELESQYDTSYRVCERLSWLYVCRDNLMRKYRPQMAERPDAQAAPETTPLDGSEFVRVASRADWEGLMSVLDEHMAAIQILYPREYESVMDKLRAMV